MAFKRILKDLRGLDDGIDDIAIGVAGDFESQNHALQHAFEKQGIFLRAILDNQVALQSQLKELSQSLQRVENDLAQLHVVD